MGSRREYSRVKIESPCLINFNDSIFRVQLDNISISGALLRVNDDELSSLDIGDSVSLMLCTNPNLCPAKYPCKVIWFDSSNIGVKFQNMAT